MRYNKRLVELRAKVWNEQRKNTLSLLQYPTIFKVSGFRCTGAYGHKGDCKNVDCSISSKDLELVP